jgi:hypothetical protein
MIGWLTLDVVQHLQVQDLCEVAPFMLAAAYPAIAAPLLSTKTMANTTSSLFPVTRQPRALACLGAKASEGLWQSVWKSQCSWVVRATRPILE